MKRVCINKATGLLIEMQSDGESSPDLMEMRLNTLLQNAINAGYAPEDIEVRWAADDEDIPIMTVEAEAALVAEKIIQAEMQDIIRQMAIDSLTVKGVL